MTQSSSSSLSSSSSSIESTLAGMGLFLVTAVVSQWIQNNHRLKRLQQEQQMQQYNHRQRRKSRRRGRPERSRSNTSCNDNYDDEEDYWSNCDFPNAEEYDGKRQREKLMISTEAFRRRRLSRRLSFQQFGDLTTTSTTATTTGSLQINVNDHFNSNDGQYGEQQSLDRRAKEQKRVDSAENFTEWSIHNSTQDLNSRRISHQKQPQQSIKRETRRMESFKTPFLNGRYHDFHPKYQNWRHFEHCNEYDRAKHRRKALLAKKQKQREQEEDLGQEQQHQRSYQHRCHQQQVAGEGASQKKDEKSKQQNLHKVPESSVGRTTPQYCDPNNNIPRQSAIDNEIDEEEEEPSAVWFSDRESDNDGSKNDDSFSCSCASFDSGNHFVWTGGRKSGQQEPDGSSKSIISFGSDHKRDPNILTHEGSEAFPSRRNRRTSMPEPSSSSRLLDASSNRKQHSFESGTKDLSSNMENTGSNSRSANSTNRDNRMGKFERFYRMLTSSSIIDDDSDFVGGSSGPIHQISLSSSISNRSSGTEYGGDIEDRHRALRTEYNALIMPEKLVLIRHGQSMGNVDETYFATTPDNSMPITDLGWEQARKAGTILKDKIISPGESVHFIVSPYVRTVETFHGIVSAWCDPDSEEFASITDHNRKVNTWYERLTELGLTWNEDSRIREQDFGNYQTPEVTRRAKEERHRFGAFYYRFNNGESGSDVYDRVSTFLDSLWRSFETNKSQNYVLITHGIVLRVLMARYFRYTISQLNMLANPRNCEMVILGHAGDGRLDLEGRCALELEEDPDAERRSRFRVKGYRFHKRLRILPKSHIRTVRFRISQRDGNI